MRRAMLGYDRRVNTALERDTLGGRAFWAVRFAAFEFWGEL